MDDTHGSDRLKSWFNLNSREHFFMNERRSKRSSYTNVSLINKLYPIYIWPLFRRSLKHKLRIEDLEDPSKEDESRLLGIQLQRLHDDDLRFDREPNLIRALFTLFKLEIILSILGDIVCTCIITTMITISFGWLIRDFGIYLNHQNQDLAASNLHHKQHDDSIRQSFNSVVLDASLLLGFAMLQTILRTPVYLLQSRLGMKCRVSICHMIYRKSIRLSQLALCQTTTGQMINMLSNDVNRFEEFSAVSPALVSGPIQATILIALLSSYVGLLPTLAALITVIFYLIVQTFMGRGFSHFRLATAKQTDKRVKLINEVISAIRIIKLYAWEKSFLNSIHEARRRELLFVALSSMLRALNLSLYLISSKTIPFFTIIIYVNRGNQLDPATTFVTLALCDSLRSCMALYFPEAFALGSEVLVSCRRIQEFLALPEVEYSPFKYKLSLGIGMKTKKKPIVMNKVTATWQHNQKKLYSTKDLSELNNNNNDQQQQQQQQQQQLQHQATIRDISFSLKPKELLLIVGRVGAGKSSILMTILGELGIDSGRIEINGTFSYAPQQAWIFPGTIRDNILMGKSLDLVRYKEVTQVCCLDQFATADMTLVGERGVSLSGGQKARVSLARALYHRADIYLLDDPLSSVDNSVARSIFEEAIQKFLRDKTVILATHQLQFLRYADKVLLVDRDHDACFGTLEQVRQTEAFQSIDFSQQSFSDSSSSKEDSESSLSSEKRNEPTNDTKRVKKPTTKRVVGTKQQQQQQQQQQQSSDMRVMHMDEPDNETVDMDTYVFYGSQITGSLGFAWYLLVIIATQTLFQSVDVLLSLWTDSVQRREFQGHKFRPLSFVDSLDMSSLINLYSLLIGLLVLFTLTSFGTSFTGLLVASKNIHNKLVTSIMSAPVSYFDFHSIGSIMNRISRDMGLVDELLPKRLNFIINILATIAGSCLVLSLIDPVNLIPISVILVLFFICRALSNRALVRIQFLEGSVRSPVFAHMVNSFQGLATIRAFRVQDRFVRLFDQYQDAHTSAWYACTFGSRLVFLMLDISIFITLALVVILQLSLSLDNSTASSLGLVITITMSLSMFVLYSLRQMSEFEAQMTSVQRLKELCEIETETENNAEPRDSSFEIIQSSSSFGEQQLTGNSAAPQIRFIDVTLRYFADEAPVINKLNLTVLSGEKIGIIGRTGAGKSSILAVLFRLYPFEGRVEIGHIDTNRMPLGRLRSSINIIPQDPVLFSTSLRKNLDPFDEHSDGSIWEALEVVHMRAYVESRGSAGLELELEDGGANLSVGQRQLVCLARAILRHGNKILVLDEATANVDPETDAFIQQTIKLKFADCTVLTIAHRLLTVVDSDRVVIIEAGQICEFGDPLELAQNKLSVFSRMIDSNEDDEASRLRTLLAEGKHRRRTTTTTTITRPNTSTQNY